jgi:hypothetical protein
VEEDKSLKEKLQQDHLDKLKSASPEEKAKIILENSGFAAAIYHNRDSVKVQFGS